MELHIKYIPRGVNSWTMTRAIADVLHSEDFPKSSEQDSDRLLNFRVELTPSSLGGVRNSGYGVLTLPYVGVARMFLNWTKDSPIKIEGQKIEFRSSQSNPSKGLLATLRKTPYINPDIEEEREQKLAELQDPLRVDAVQFGLLYRPSYPRTPNQRLESRVFAIEWELDLVNDSVGWLRFEYDHKLIRVELGNPNTEPQGKSIAIPFSSIARIAVGYAGKPYLVFDTITPPLLEEIDHHRALTGKDHIDNQKFRRRIGSLHPGHARVAPYAQKLRVVLYKGYNVDNIAIFERLCVTAGLGINIIIKPFVDSHRRDFFSDKRLHRLQTRLRKLDWPIAFQIETLLHNALLHTDDLDLDLLPKIDKLCKVHRNDGGEYVGNVLRRFCQALQSRSARESPVNCFDRVLQNFTFVPIQPQAGNFLCCHVTFAPTRLILEGPYATQSNRIIRNYKGYEMNFIRVDFRDEDKLNYRWDAQVDGTTFLNERVGSTLKNGFDLAGRHFDFLAYSSSALREHAVWFMQSFQHHQDGWITPSRIRDTIGDFTGTDLLNCPSKYAARLAQAFTATVPSVRIRRDEWEEVPDLGEEPYLFTDGVGTISKKLGDRIWSQLCADGGHTNSIQPSAYQIRFIGYKGVVAVDEQLDNNDHGISMRLRPSMRKFENKGAEEEADIEIARAFDYPNSSYLNRPLVMLLEDLGGRVNAFMTLQEQAVAEARTIDDSIEQFREALRSHHLGGSYRISYLLERIRDLGLDLGISARINKSPDIDNPFLRQLRQVATISVLRDIKHGARIKLPNSWLLVGVADEGPAYLNAGYDNVFCLEKGQIYACIQSPGDPEPIWVEGHCIVSRSPVVHPGDVQRVVAIGKPPKDKLCLFANLKNVVVMPSRGPRSLPSCLGGGDLDGDQFDVIQYAPLLPGRDHPPASYPPGQVHNIGRASTVEDICDFIVQYINSDVLGLLSTRHLIIADQSNLGTTDPHCLALAALCSQAVDYPKLGIPVDLDTNKLPPTLIRCKPDWQAAEVVTPRDTDYYQSSRALGHLYRGITLDDPEPIPIACAANGRQPLTDPITMALKPQIKRYIQQGHLSDDHADAPDIKQLFQRYVDELQYIASVHTLSNTPGVTVLEAEIVLGTLLAKCTQKRYRSDRMYRMRLNASILVHDIRQEMLPDKVQNLPNEMLTASLEMAWKAWCFSLHRQGQFGSDSFALIALGTIFDSLDALSESMNGKIGQPLSVDR